MVLLKNAVIMRIMAETFAAWCKDLEDDAAKWDRSREVAALTPDLLHYFFSEGVAPTYADLLQFCKGSRK
jgi:hypothetical protein